MKHGKGRLRRVSFFFCKKKGEKTPKETNKRVLNYEKICLACSRSCSKLYSATNTHFGGLIDTKELCSSCRKDIQGVTNENSLQFSLDKLQSRIGKKIILNFDIDKSNPEVGETVWDNK